jgi:hypothetical protein
MSGAAVNGQIVLEEEYAWLIRLLLLITRKFQVRRSIWAHWRRYIEKIAAILNKLKHRDRGICKVPRDGRRRGQAFVLDRARISESAASVRLETMVGKPEKSPVLFYLTLRYFCSTVNPRTEIYITSILQRVKAFGIIRVTSITDSCMNAKKINRSKHRPAWKEARVSEALNWWIFICSSCMVSWLRCLFLFPAINYRESRKTQKRNHQSARHCRRSDTRPEINHPNCCEIPCSIAISRETRDCRTDGIF